VAVLVVAAHKAAPCCGWRSSRSAGPAGYRRDPPGQRPDQRRAERMGCRGSPGGLGARP
jgi:hypothetical protein